MPANQETRAADIARVQDIDFVYQFEQGVTALLNVLGIADPEVLGAGTQIVQYRITGKLESGVVAEGEDIPLSKYIQVKENTYTVDLKEYRKATTAQAIIRGGYQTAVGKTDAKMVRDIQGVIRNEFFEFLANGTGHATGLNFQAAFAAAWGTLANALSELDADGTPVYFANPLDLAAYLGAAQLNNVETAFGFTYIRNFLGLGTCVFDAKVPRGVIYATPSENINCYTIDLSELAKAGLEFEISDETGLIGVHHTPVYKNGTAETYADTGMLLFPEVSNYIIKCTIDANPLGEVTVAPKAGSATMFGHRVSTLQTGLQVKGDKITGTLKYVSSGALVDTWGEGYFMALQFSNKDANATDVKVGMQPSVSSGMVSLDADMDGVFKVTDPTKQRFEVVSLADGHETWQCFDLSGITFSE